MCPLVCPDPSSLIAYILGTYIQDPNDPKGFANDIVGISWVTFDSTSGTAGSATPRIFVGVANMGANSIFVSKDAGATCESPLRSLVQEHMFTLHRERRPWPANSIHSAQGRNLSFRCRVLSNLSGQSTYLNYRNCSTSRTPMVQVRDSAVRLKYRLFFA